MKRRFNLIDFFICCGILFVIFFFLKRTNIKEAMEPDTRHVRFTCLVEELPKGAFDDLKVGDKLFAEYQTQKGEIKEKALYPNEEYSISGGNYDWMQKKDELYAVVECEADVAYKGPYMQLGGQEIKAGIDYILKTEKFSANSKIIFAEVIE